MAEQRGQVRVEAGQKRVRTYLGGELVADTKRPMLVWDVPYYPAYYLPIEDVRGDLLVATATVTHSPSRGDVHHFTVKAGGSEAIDAASTFPNSPIEALRSLVRIVWGAMDHWFEEDEEVFVHPRIRTPGIDILPSVREGYASRSTGSPWPRRSSPRLLFEIGLPVRYYLAKTDLRLDLLVPSETVDTLSVQGHDHPLLGQDRRRGAAGRGLELSGAGRRKPEDRRAGVLLQRAGRPLRRRRAPRPPEHALLLTTHETGSAFADSVGTTKGGPT